MKTKLAPIPNTAAEEPLEEEIRDYAFHLYEQNGCAPGHDLDNWLEAKACILTNVPQHASRGRLHRHLERVVL